MNARRERKGSIGRAMLRNVWAGENGRLLVEDLIAMDIVTIIVNHSVPI